MVLSNQYYYDISNHDITYEFINHTVTAVLVKGTNTWPFAQNGFDESLAKAAVAKNDLPTEIDFVLDNETKVKFIGDSLEYYRIQLDK